MILTLPYPISNNVYWRTRSYKGRSITYVSPEAVAYKTAVGLISRVAGVRTPIAGRIALSISLYPSRPQDWERRAKKDPHGWDDTIKCIDLDNAQKVLLDALKNVVFEDDKWVRSITAERMTPDGEARVIVGIKKWEARACEPLFRRQ